MKLTAQNILELPIGSTVWVVEDAFSEIQDRIYIGEDDVHMFFVHPSCPGFAIYKANPQSNLYLKAGRLFTTKLAAIAQARELALEEIKHYNKSYFIGNPILTVQEDTDYKGKMHVVKEDLKLPYEQMREAGTAIEFALMNGKEMPDEFVMQRILAAQVNIKTIEKKLETWSRK